MEDFLKKRVGNPAIAPKPFASPKNDFERSSPILGRNLTRDKPSPPAGKRLPRKYHRRAKSPTESEQNLKKKEEELRIREAEICRREKALMEAASSSAMNSIEKQEKGLSSDFSPFTPSVNASSRSAKSAERRRARAIRKANWDAKQEAFSAKLAETEESRKATQVNSLRKISLNSPTQQRLYGIDAEIAQKLDSKYQLADWQAAIGWIEEVLGYSISNDPILSKNDFHRALYNGVALCKLINKIYPKTIDKIHTRGIPLAEKENVQKFIDATEKLGVNSMDLFMASDLYEKKCLPAVMQNLNALGRCLQTRGDFKGPHYGIRVNKNGKKPARKWNVPSNENFLRY
eukprot:Plantae.Rhodophyta-Palmaria_palmata.ctg12275.p1 GENE.Plantae.Rhodophyta-Palmaria_palmata.ctg12275~~Plantae.Rhodophyta-Palmaria_palmata.ctg12275.p1  ORF type:complete len:353 (-),score=46.45 Plantae.Rhodophyta-Palmaria_palmata.ctg12275:43-1080(-)